MIDKLFKSTTSRIVYRSDVPRKLHYITCKCGEKWHYFESDFKSREARHLDIEGIVYRCKHRVICPSCKKYMTDTLLLMWECTTSTTSTTSVLTEVKEAIYKRYEKRKIR